MQIKQSSEKYQIDEEALRNYLIEKEKVDELLWKRIKEKSNGDEEERRTAIKLIFSSYKKVPIEADGLLKSFASLKQPSNVRKTLAIQICENKNEIPASLYFDLIITMSKDRSKKIRKLIVPEIEEWLRPLTKLQKILKEIEKFKQKSIYREFEFNWLTFLTFDQMLALLKMHKEGNDKDIRKMLIRVSKNKTFLQNFKEELSGIPIFQPRLHVLKETLEAHVDGKFALSIPSMLAQIEGILWDIATKKGFAIGTCIIDPQGKRKPVKSVSPVVSETPLYYLMTDYLAEFFLHKIYTHNFRHAILHGRNPNYDKAEDSMKLIMLLRTLMEIGKNC